MLQILCTAHSKRGTLYKEMDNQTLKKDCANRQKILGEPNFVDTEKANGPILGPHCEME